MSIRIKINGKMCTGSKEAITKFRATQEEVFVSEKIDLYNSVVENKIDNILDRLCYLADRWDDESEYEDFKDYKSNIKTVVEEQGFHFIKLTKAFSVTMSKSKDDVVFIKITKTGKIEQAIDGQALFNRFEK